MPYCQAEFWYIGSGLFLSCLPCPLNLVLQILSPFHFVPPCLQSSNDQSQPKPDAKWKENSFIIQMQTGPCEKVNITINFTWCKTQSLKLTNSKNANWNFENWFLFEGGSMDRKKSYQTCASELQLQLYYINFDKRKIQNGCFPQIALASRGRKRQERIGLHHSLSNLNKVWRK